MLDQDSHRSSSQEIQNKRGKANTSNNNNNNNNKGECPPMPKKARVLLENTLSSSPCRLSSFTATDAESAHVGSPGKCLPTRWLINDYEDSISAKMPLTLSLNDVVAGTIDNDTYKKKTKIGQDPDKLRRLLDIHGLRTTKISSPREAVSIYKDSCRIGHTNSDEDISLRDGNEFLLVAFGIHPHQEDIEKEYETCTKNAYCVLLFCQKIRQEYCNLQRLSSSSSPPVENDTTTDANENVRRLFRQIEQTLQFAKEFTTNDGCGISSRFAKEQVETLIELAVMVKGRRCYRKEEWRKEYQRIRISNSTVSNAYIFLLQSAHGMCIKDIYFKFNRQEPKYERITIYLYDPAIDEGRRPDFFLFLPGLHTILTKGPHVLVSEIIDSFWTCVIRNGYFPTTKLQGVLESKLRCFFLSGITSTNIATANANNLPIPLKANFLPTSPLSIYLHGKAGSGKSSLAKVLPIALQSTLEKYVDPECMARFVKQNLNKCIKTLELEFELRPNNNDMSIMSIIQGRRMSMSQSKPGLVVLNLEEMPMHSSGSNPNQLSVAQLISQRFGGRKGNYQEDQLAGRYKLAPRNSDKRSIGRDYSLVTIFTSNYPLAEDSKLALQRLELYQSLLPIEMSAITGSDRCQFAKSYLRQCLLEFREENWLEISTQNIILDMSSSEGDTRPLVRQLRMYSYHLRKLLRTNISQKEGLVTMKGIQVSQSETNCTLTIETEVGGEPIRKTQQHLKIGGLGTWFPAGTFTFDSKIKVATEKLIEMVEGDKIAELAVILEFWFSATLAPTVILSRDKKVITHLMDAIESMSGDIHCIRNVNTHTYKMIKSLYDPKEMPNLRDDILKFGSGALVATELNCPTEDSQLCIREMIEDSPSMTAFSSTKSALYKSGLLFAIHVEGDITPEILSRVSIVI